MCVPPISPNKSARRFALRRLIERENLPSVVNGEQPITVSGNGGLYVYQPGELPARVFLLDVQTGQRTVWRQLMPSDPAGVVTIGPILLTPTPVRAYTAITARSPIFTLSRAAGNPTTARLPARIVGTS